LRHGPFGQLSSFGRTGQIFMVRPCVAGQGRTTRLTPEQAARGVRVEGAGRSSPCLPEAVFISGIFMSATCMTSLRLYLSGTGIDPCGACDSFFLHRKG
jgi:hypothetical protein